MAPSTRNVRRQLTDRLAEQSPADIVAFADHLAQVLHELDGPERAAQLVVDPTVDDEPMTMSDDLFLYARCAVVAAGRRTFDVVLADPAQMARTWPVFDGEHLLGVAPAAYELATGDPFDHEAPVSYETGSDIQAEGGGTGSDTSIEAAASRDREPTQDELLDVAVQNRRGRGWMSVTSSAENRLPWRPVYHRYQGEYVNWINHDYAWTRWWVSHPYRDLIINAWLDPDNDESPAANKGSKDLTLDLHLDGRFLLSTNRRVHLHRARADLQRLLDLAVDTSGSTRLRRYLPNPPRRQRSISTSPNPTTIHPQTASGGNGWHRHGIRVTSTWAARGWARSNAHPHCLALSPQGERPTVPAGLGLGTPPRSAPSPQRDR